MSKITNFAAVIIILFVVGLLFIMAIGVDFTQDNGWEKFLEANKWTAYSLGIIIGLGWGVMKYLNAISDHEHIKSNAKIEKHQNKSIELQEKIVENQEAKFEIDTKNRDLISDLKDDFRDVISDLREERKKFSSKYEDIAQVKKDVDGLKGELREHIQSHKQQA